MSADLSETDATVHPEENADSAALFVGDTGQLDVDTRRALVRLIRGPFLDGSADELVWAALLRNQAVVRQYLSEIFLTLMVDDAERVAFCQQASEADVAFPKLLRRVPLTLIDSALLLFLRQQLSTVTGTGNRAIVGLDDITAQLQPYQRDATSDHSIHLKRINGAVKKMRDNGILRSTTTEARFEISPVLRILFPPEQIAALTDSYERFTDSYERFTDSYERSADVHQQFAGASEDGSESEDVSADESDPLDE